MPGPQDGSPQYPLVFGAHSGPACRLYFGPVRQVAPEPVHVLVIDGFDVLDTEGTDPPPRSKPAPGTTPGTGGASGPGPTAGLVPSS